ncbi:MULTISPECIES: hypothetical protein [unclassified Tenacibaculum]|uniref:hypothetical protein n=1 Tax=unclassified Tenacibaculum TaxID=2635139 RepID=UPI001F160262|nr:MULTISPECIES: hypothetical protein [unclassified Tenacibaculum]MCF2875389.1 hypothetical protein [Tenacibaculum sp. Cn5-1]MCF2935465.1 hypothetical protein [Tenacibaculum sp. Cn5-34]MCG7512025.1 hypothetical protein [Tenacibaculum sp. Cn5-46]
MTKTFNLTEEQFLIITQAINEFELSGKANNTMIAQNVNRKKLINETIVRLTITTHEDTFQDLVDYINTHLKNGKL